MSTDPLKSLTTQDLEDRCRRLRQMGLDGHWAYDLPMHVAMFCELQKRRRQAAETEAAIRSGLKAMAGEIDKIDDHLADAITAVHLSRQRRPHEWPGIL